MIDKLSWIPTPTLCDPVIVLAFRTQRRTKDVDPGLKQIMSINKNTFYVLDTIMRVCKELTVP